MYFQYSIYSRAKSATQFNVPGPGAYRNEDVRSAWKAAPKYSLSARAKSGNSNASPGDKINCTLVAYCSVFSTKIQISTVIANLIFKNIFRILQHLLINDCYYLRPRGVSPAKIFSCKARNTSLHYENKTEHWFIYGGLSKGLQFYFMHSNLTRMEKVNLKELIF